MLVESLAHGKRVFDELARNPWIVLDTETEPKPPFNNKRDSLVWGRQHIWIFSACYKGKSFSFPTSNFSSKYPTPRQWFELLRPIFRNRKIVKVFHNANYDTAVFDTSIEETNWKNVWCTLIGGWMANPSLLSLKGRATNFGRFLQETSNIDFTDINEVSTYAEEDVLVADEMYQMQRYGYIERPANFTYPLPGGGLHVFANRMPHLGRIEIPNEGLRPFDRVWLECFEFPVLYSTIRAERVGFPLDQKFLRKVRKRMARDLEKYLRQIYRYAGKKINLNSEKDIRWLFTKLKIRNPYKTPKGKMAINKNVLPRLITAHPVIQLLINRKKIQTLLDFYFGSLKKDGTAKDRGLAYFVNPTDGRIHATLSTVGAVTGRHSCSNPNLMQIPSRADIYEIKRAFVAPGKETR